MTTAGNGKYFFLPTNSVRQIKHYLNFGSYVSENTASQLQKSNTYRSLGK